MFNDRKSGILCHPTSLPSHWGIGDLGENAYKFIEYLHGEGHGLWQVLPLGPASLTDDCCPYSSYSGFALSELLISPEILQRKGLLPASIEPENSDPKRVQFSQVIASKEKLFRIAFAAFKETPKFEEFCSENSYWLSDFALFVALKKNFSGISWSQWPQGVRDRMDLGAWEKKLDNEIRYQKFLQFEVFSQWEELRVFGHMRGVKIVGDLPIYISGESADVWSHPELFCLEDGKPTLVTGVPPDDFSSTGQLWNHPCYNWDSHKEERFEWWTERFRVALRFVDMIRVDHFRGFCGFWGIPGGDKTAEHGSWLPSPGDELFEAAEKLLGRLPIIAEDLGVITPDVTALRDAFGFMGMKVLQMGFGNVKDNRAFLPHLHTQNFAVYPGTHDNDTLIGWLKTLPKEKYEFLKTYLDVSGEVTPKDLMRLTLSSVAEVAIIPLQDVLGSSERMNHPGTTGAQNWTWRFTENELEKAESLKEIIKLFDRR